MCSSIVAPLIEWGLIERDKLLIDLGEQIGDGLFGLAHDVPEQPRIAPLHDAPGSKASDLHLQTKQRRMLAQRRRAKLWHELLQRVVNISKPAKRAVLPPSNTRLVHELLQHVGLFTTSFGLLLSR